MLVAPNQRAQDAAAYRQMAAEYYRVSSAHPHRNRHIAARDAGLRAFRLSLAALSDCRAQNVAQARMKLMAAVTILTDGNRAAVGRTFKRWRSTVNHAMKLFEDDIREALCSVKPGTKG